jgi:hypothetical protein
MLCSWVAGGMASLITNPLDLAKLRLQVQRGSGSDKIRYKNMFHAIYVIGKEESCRGLFKGSGARMLFHIPMTAIAMSVVEVVRPYVSHVL